ncbi:MAG TPA: LysR family transcriptional regulator [Solirubrobacteraceae bacterium]|jgi:DNA-binding transcriptional LysR family regulator|nr:LysR family transcriptional regulator [Solirubrobacteraceae bacterium]
MKPCCKVGYVLNVTRLAVFHAVVSTGSVTAAAAELSYTPSAVSQHVAALERETGTALLERVGRRVRPTPAGVLLAERAGEILRQVEDAEIELRALVAGRAGRLRVGTFASAGTGLVPPAVSHFKDAHPVVQLDLALVEAPDALLALRRGDADVVVVIRDVICDGVAPVWPHEDAGLIWHELLTDPYFATLPSGHRLCESEAVTLGELGSERLVSGDGRRGCPCAEAFLQVCAAAGFRPDFAIEVDDYPTAQSLVAAGVGLAAVPLLGLSAGVHPGIAVRQLTEPRMARRIYAVTRSSRRDDRLTEAMLASLRRAADELAIPDAIALGYAQAA